MTKETLNDWFLKEPATPMPYDPCEYFTCYRCKQEKDRSEEPADTSHSFGLAPVEATISSRRLLTTQGLFLSIS
jgi:hypothetical protein